MDSYEFLFCLVKGVIDFLDGDSCMDGSSEALTTLNEEWKSPLLAWWSHGLIIGIWLVMKLSLLFLALKGESAAGVAFFWMIPLVLDLVVWFHLYSNFSFSLICCDYLPFLFWDAGLLVATAGTELLPLGIYWSIEPFLLCFWDCSLSIEQVSLGILEMKDFLSGCWIVEG